MESALQLRLSRPLKGPLQWGTLFHTWLMGNVEHTEPEGKRSSTCIVFVVVSFLHGVKINILFDVSLYLLRHSSLSEILELLSFRKSIFTFPWQDGCRVLVASLPHSFFRFSGFLASSKTFQWVNWDISLSLGWCARGCTFFSHLPHKVYIAYC